MDDVKIDITNVTVINLKVAKIDVENGIIHKMSIMSNQAVDTSGKVFRRFTDDAMRDALVIFEGAMARIDHDRDAINAGNDRGVKTGYGVYKNIVMDGDMIFGDLHLWDCPEAKKVLSIAQKTPNAVGNSIHTGGIVASTDGGIELVKKLLPRNKAGHLASIDLVDDPSATLSMFNDKRNVQNERKNDMEWKDITAESLKTNRPDLHEAIKTEGYNSRNGEIKTITQERDDVAKKCDALAVKQASTEREILVNKLVAESELPDYAKTDIFLGQLLDVKEVKKGDKVTTVEDGIKALIQDRIAALEPCGVHGNGEKDVRQSKDQKASDEEFVDTFSVRRGE